MKHLQSQVIVLLFLVFTFLNGFGQDSNKIHVQDSNKFTSSINQAELHSNAQHSIANSPSNEQSNLSFNIANYSISILTIIIAIFTIISVFFYYKDRKDRKNILLIKEYKKDIKRVKKDFEKLETLLIQKIEFNHIAAETTFQSIEYLSQMMLMQNPDLDKGKKFLNRISVNKAILYLYHEDKETRRRALKELQYYGTSSCIETLKKYRDEVGDKDLADLADETIAEIFKKEGRKEVLNEIKKGKKPSP